MLYYDIQYLHLIILCNFAAMLALCELGTQRQMFLNSIILYFMVVFNFIMCFLEKDDEISCFKTEMEERSNGCVQSS